MNTTPPPLDRETALGLLGAVVAEQPDYVYVADHHIGGTPVCAYVVNDAPSCVVGRVLARHGWPIESLRDFDDRGLSAFGLPYAVGDRAARNTLVEAQRIQDVGGSWVDALAGAADLTRGT